MRQRLGTFLLAAATAGLMSGCAGGASSREPAIRPSGLFSDVETVLLEGPDGEREILDVLIADTSEKRAFGLMRRTELPDDAGMLFVFGEDHDGGFWMKNTLIPLSIAYLAADGEIVRILDMEPCRRDPCPVYDPGVPYRFALEVNRGWFAEAGIAPGWRLADRPAGRAD